MQLMKRQEGWDPFREFEDLSSRFSRLFGISRSGNGEREALAMTDWSPVCDIVETEKEYRVHAELPNVNKDAVHVTLDNGILTISGERREEKEDRGVRLHRREVVYGNFMRKFSMPDDADPTKVDASYKDGMLNIAIPKTKSKSSQVKEITIHS